MQLFVLTAAALQVLDLAFSCGSRCTRLFRDPATSSLNRYTIISCGSYGCEISIAHFAAGLGKPETLNRNT